MLIAASVKNKTFLKTINGGASVLDDILQTLES